MFIRSAMRCLVATLVFALSGATVNADAADDYPTKPIRILSGFAPGGSSDVMARMLAEKLTESLGQPVVVENRVGASGTIAGTAVARAAPDGYVLLVASLSNGVISPLMLKEPPYNPVKDFAPIIQAASTPLVLIVNKSLPVSSARELIAMGKAKPGEFNFTTGGSGTATGMAAELFNFMSGMKAQHIPYNGDAPAVTAILAGTGTFSIPALPAAMQHIKAGTLKALGVATPKRISALPDVPTISESGLPGYEVDVWSGVLAPAGTPKDIVARLNREIVKILKQPEFAARLSGMGFELVAGTPEEFAAVIRSDMAKWPKVIKDTGARID